jgi:hypothetical protein
MAAWLGQCRLVMGSCIGCRVWHGETLSDRALQGEVLRQPLIAPELLLLWRWNRLLRFCCLGEWGGCEFPVEPIG